MQRYPFLALLLHQKAGCVCGIDGVTTSRSLSVGRLDNFTHSAIENSLKDNYSAEVANRVLSRLQGFKSDSLYILLTFKHLLRHNPVKKLRQLLSRAQ